MINSPRTLIGFGLLLITVYSGMVGNETILPSALVSLGIFLRSLGRKTEKHIPQGSSPTEQAARYAITTYAVFIALLSLFVSLFLPTVSNHFGWNGLYDGDFVRVTINDMHEFAYATCLLLLINAAYFFYFRFKQKGVKLQAQAQPILK